MTPKQEAFVREYLVDLNATQAAIRAGYSERTAESIGSENLKKPEISNSIRAARAKVAESAELTVMEHLHTLLKLRDEARLSGKFSAAIAAEIARGRVAGFYVERLEHSGSPTVIVKDYTGRDSQEAKQ